MTKPLADRFSFAKIVAVFAVAFIVGMGLCGLDYLLGANGIGKRDEEFSVGPLDGLSLVVMILSAFGLVISLIAWAVAGIISSDATGRETDGSSRISDSDQDKGRLPESEADAPRKDPHD